MKIPSVSQVWVASVLLAFACSSTRSASTNIFEVDETTVSMDTTTATDLGDATTMNIVTESTLRSDGTKENEIEFTTLDNTLDTTTVKSTTPKKTCKKKIYFPRDVKRCSANDPDLDACFKEAANKMIKHIQPGIRRLGILPMDPLRVPLVALPRNNHLLPSLAFNATDTEQHGWRDAQVIDVAMDIKNYTMHAEIYFPRYRLLGKYSVEGELLDFIPLEGEGDFDIKLDESRFGVTCRGHLVERRSRRHLEIDKVSIVTNFGRIHIHLTNLFGDEQLSDLTNALINQNSDLVVDKSGPAIESVSSELYRGLLQRFFDVVPWDSLFTDLPN